MPRFFIESRLSPHISETPEGFLLCAAVPIARAGELRYQAHETPITPGSGDTIIHRTADDLHDAATLASFEGKPVTLHHPEDFVTPETWKELAVGIAQNVRAGTGADADKIFADLLITDAEAIDMVKSRKLREVSCGYEAEYTEDAPGRGRQTQIRGNHIALVQSGRCGSSCAILDHAPKPERDALMSVKNRLMRMFGRALDAELPDGVIVDTDENVTDEDVIIDADDPMLDADETLGDAEMEAMLMDADEDATVNEDFGARLAHIEEMLQRIMDAMQLGAMDSDEPMLDADDPMLDADETATDEEVIVDAEEDVVIADEGEKTCDAETAARAEILAPGIAKTGDVKAKALKAAYATKDGREVIDMLTPGKRVISDVDGLFVAASELMRARRRSAAHRARPTIDNLPTIQAGAITPEKINAMNAARYGRK